MAKSSTKESLIDAVEQNLNAEGIAIGRDAIRQIVPTIDENKVVLDFLATH